MAGKAAPQDEKEPVSAAHFSSRRGNKRRHAKKSPKIHSSNNHFPAWNGHDNEFLDDAWTKPRRSDQGEW